MKNTFYIVVFLFFLYSENKAQSVYQPYSFNYYQKLDSSVYSTQSRFHSALKPFFIDDSLVVNQAELRLEVGSDTAGKKKWVLRKLFSEHLIDVRKSDYTIYADFLPDLVVGKDFSGNKKTWLNTRGYQVGGTIGSKFSFYTSGFENQAVFPNYYLKYVQAKNVVPGQSYERKPNETTKDWSYVSAWLSYTPIKYLNITLGQDKNFIGDGYRSMILSDYTTNYPFLKLTAKLGNIQYMAMWAAFQDPSAQRLSYDAGNRKKGGVFHYLDWNVTNRLSVGFFDAVVWAETDDAGNRRGFDWGYINPVIFLRPLEAMSGSPDNAMIGLTAKYEVLGSLTLYGQYALDEFEAKNFFSKTGSSRNKWGLQVGARGANLLKIKGLNYLAEYNTAKPYTYSSRTSILNYAHYNEPLAHPYGANFKEIVGILNYPYKRFDITGQLNYAKYGLDIGTANYGKDPFKPYPTAVKQTGNFIGQGITTNFLYLDGRIAFIVNPKYNLRLELGGIFRKESSLLNVPNTSMITFGLRSSFRNLYQDF